MKPRLLNQACWILLLLVSCAHPRNDVFPANSAHLPSKLGVSDADWRDIQALIKLEKDESNKPYEVVYLERNQLGLVVAWMAHHTPGETRPQGPVFFYFKDRGHWYRLEDMSEWGNQ